MQIMKMKLVKLVKRMTKKNKDEAWNRYIELRRKQNKTKQEQSELRQLFIVCHTVYGKVDDTKCLK